MIKAKPVVPDRYWILRDQDRKIGNITVTDHGYAVKIGDHIDTYKNLRSLKRKISVDFETPPSQTSSKEKNEIYGYPVDCQIYNPMFDVKSQLPLFTKEPNSRSWFAAGYYRIQHHSRYQIVFCPKLILLQRYQYQGPFATNSINELTHS